MRLPERFGARLGIGICLLGFVLIFLGWNGAASVNSLTAQFPYLISGGIGGLALVVIGAALIVVESSRDDRDRLHDEVAELKSALSGPAAPVQDGQRPKPVAPAPVARGRFVRGEHSYHLPTCRLLEGRGELPSVGREEITKRHLVPCRVCKPDGTPAPRKASRR
jgi:hypothetical protein